MDRQPFEWLNRVVFVSHGNFIMSAPHQPDNFDPTNGAIVGNPGEPVIDVEALDPVRLVIHTVHGKRFIIHGDPAWAGSAMRPVNPSMEKYS